MTAPYDDEIDWHAGVRGDTRGAKISIACLAAAVLLIGMAVVWMLF
ncbi:hypothetical protein [Tsuneonella sp. HG222]